jgi:3-hydroxyacyl-CoA dehydrogenase
VRLPTVEVVASTSETVSATCRRTSGSLALIASLSPPVGRQGRGPFRSGVHAEMIAAAWWVVGAEVAATVGADVVASAGEPLGASYLAALTGVEVVHTCRVEMKLELHLKINVILTLFVRYSRVLFIKQY